MPHPSSGEAITYTLCETELIAYSDPMTKRQAKSVPPRRDDPRAPGASCIADGRLRIARRG
jgi:hypothetical protein